MCELTSTAKMGIKVLDQGFLRNNSKRKTTKKGKSKLPNPLPPPQETSELPNL